MTSFEIGAIVVAIVALVLLIVCVVLLVNVKKRKKEHMGHKVKERRMHEDEGSDEARESTEDRMHQEEDFSHEVRKKAEIKGKKKHHAEHVNGEAVASKGEPRLDGARVSHRRDHPERVAQEEMWKQKQREVSEVVQRQQEYERKNHLRLVYSPCTGEVLYLAESEEEALKNGFKNPGLVINPSDDKVYAPVNGKITQIENEKSRIYMQSERGLNIVLQQV